VSTIYTSLNTPKTLFVICPLLKRLCSCAKPWGWSEARVQPRDSHRGAKRGLTTERERERTRLGLFMLCFITKRGRSGTSTWGSHSQTMWRGSPGWL